MMRFTICMAILPVLMATISQDLTENSINIRSHFNAVKNECNIFDEAHYCQQIVIDQRLTLTAVSHKCSCPAGYLCPSDITDTQATTQCTYDEERHWHRCTMRCTPQA